jgi:hypothetical protein
MNHFFWIEKIEFPHYTLNNSAKIPGPHRQKSIWIYNEIFIFKNDAKLLAKPTKNIQRNNLFMSGSLLNDRKGGNEDFRNRIKNHRQQINLNGTLHNFSSRKWKRVKRWFALITYRQAVTGKFYDYYIGVVDVFLFIWSLQFFKTIPGVNECFVHLSAAVA